MPPEMRRLKLLEGENAKQEACRGFVCQATCETGPSVSSVKAEDWRNGHNEVRPHGAIGNVPLVTLVVPSGAPDPPPERARKL